MFAMPILSELVLSVSHSVMSDSYPMDYSPPGSPVHGILQANSGVGAMPSSKGSSQPRNWTHVFCGSGIAGRSFTTEPPGKPKWAWGSTKRAIREWSWCSSRPCPQAPTLTQDLPPMMFHHLLFVLSLSWFCQPVPSFLFLLQLVHAFDCPTFPADTFLCVWIWASTLYVSIPFWFSLWNSPTLRIWLCLLLLSLGHSFWTKISHHIASIAIGSPEMAAFAHGFGL